MANLRNFCLVKDKSYENKTQLRKSINTMALTDKRTDLSVINQPIVQITIHKHMQENLIMEMLTYMHIIRKHNRYILITLNQFTNNYH